MQGKIIKGIAGFYYVHVVGSGIYECKAKGIFRKEKIKPLVGDNVCIDVLDELEKKGNLIEIMQRKNELIRPAVANIDQAFIIFALQDPRPSLALLDRFLISMEYQGVPTKICFNKSDLASDVEVQKLCDIYRNCGYEVLVASASNEDGIDQIKEVLHGKTTAVAGPSGVGKSTITNLLQKDIYMETGEISQKLGRGKHTTRHSQLIPIDDVTYFMDTPGFSSLDVEQMEKEELKQYFIEFDPYEGHCKFQGCVHIHEPKCAVKTALEDGKLSKERYKNYIDFYEELKDREKRRY